MTASTDGRPLIKYNMMYLPLYSSFSSLDLRFFSPDRAFEEPQDTHAGRLTTASLYLFPLYYIRSPGFYPTHGTWVFSYKETALGSRP